MTHQYYSGNVYSFSKEKLKPFFIMKTIKLFFSISLLLVTSFAYSQSRYWALNPFQKYDTYTRQVSNLPFNPSNSFGATQGLFDNAGNLIFGVKNRSIINQQGNIIGILPVSVSPSGVSILIQDAIIVPVPVPGGGCASYYILYAYSTDASNQPSGGGHVSALTINVGDDQNITTGNVTHLNYPDISAIFSRKTRLAVTKEANGRRTLYASMSMSASPNFDTRQIAQIKVDHQGISKESATYDSKTNQLIVGNSLELSPSERYLGFLTQTNVTIMDVTTGNTSTVSDSDIGPESTLEFLDDNRLYVTSRRGILLINRAANSVSLVPNTSTVGANGHSIYYGGDIERSNSDIFDFYVSATNNTVALMKWWWGTTVTPNVFTYAGLDFPQQANRDNVVYSCQSGGGNNGGGTPTPGGGQTVMRTTKGNLASQLSIYPNPATNQVNVKVSHEEKITQIQLFNFSGKQVQQIKGNQQAQQQLSTIGLPRGMYVILISTKGQTYRKKLIVK